MPRVRVYENEENAKRLFETFADKSVKKRIKLPDWPDVWQNVGDSLGLAYSSDKWRGDEDLELYKHIAESRNRAFCVPGFLRNWDDPKKSWPVIGPKILASKMPMPRDFAAMCLFEEINLELYTAGTDAHPRFASAKANAHGSTRSGGDTGIVKVQVAHAFIGGAELKWSLMDPSLQDELFLFVYTKKDGPLIMIRGDELDVEPEGIVG